MRRAERSRCPIGEFNKSRKEREDEGKLVPNSSDDDDDEAATVADSKIVGTGAAFNRMIVSAR